MSRRTFFTLALFALAAPLAAHAEEAVAYKAAVKVTPLLKTTTTSSGAPIHYPAIDDPEVTAVIVDIPPGAETGWHKHPVPAYAYMIDGEIEVEVRDGAKRVFKAGDAFAEMVDTEHNGRNLGTEPVKILMFVTGKRSWPFTVKAE